jgi:hypothetical protein
MGICDADLSCAPSQDISVRANFTDRRRSPEHEHSGLRHVLAGLLLQRRHSRCQVHPPLISKAYAPETSTVSGPLKLLLSRMLLVSVLPKVA